MINMARPSHSNLLPHLSQFAQQILDASNSPEAKTCIDPMLSACCQYLDIDLHPEIFIDDGYTSTQYGKAVSTTTAAQCAEDYERSRLFIQGTFHAIQDQLNANPQQTIQLLYAGTGPFGWLILPLLSQFTAEQLQVTALDIHENSLKKFKRLCTHYGVEDRIKSFICADACSWNNPNAITFDIILSETMKYLLQQEPQVQIFAWLQQYLHKDGVLIPEAVTLSVTLHWQENQLHEVHLGEAFQLDRSTAKKIAEGDTCVLSKDFILPAFELGPVDVKLSTHIKIYKEYSLDENQSQLTLPRFKNGLHMQPRAVLTTQYQMGNYPDLLIKYENFTPSLVPSDDLSAGGIYHLYRLWQKSHYKNMNTAATQKDEWWLDRAVLDVAGLGLELGMQTLYQSKRLSDLNRAIDKLRLSAEDKSAINRKILTLLEGYKESSIEPVLNQEQLHFWETHGYLVIPNVLTQAQCESSRNAIWSYLQASQNQPETWYQVNESMKKIMLQLFRHPTLDENRKTPQIKKIFEQLWQRKNLSMSTDRVSFNPPETATWTFPGPAMHWDLPLQAPVPFGTQGLIYLTDTAENQGAFCCVPGFHLKIDAWLQNQPEKSDAELQQQHWHEWAVTPIAANAGDLIIWHHALPHGASPNTAQLPRMVQYINMYPVA